MDFAAQTSPAPDRIARARVVVADDNPLLGRLLRAALGAHGGLEVVGHAADGRAALALALALRPDAIVLDLTMPLMDGLEAAAAIRAQLPACAIVMFSELEAAAVAGAALAAGADCYLEKAGGLAPVAEAVASLTAR
jgi:DNA-binding NarL/FixJ family response regulator